MRECANVQIYFLNGGYDLLKNLVLLLIIHHQDMEFTIDALKRLEFDAVLCDIVNQINAKDQLAKYEYRDRELKVTVNDNLVRKMDPEQLSQLLKVK